MWLFVIGVIALLIGFALLFQHVKVEDGRHPQTRERQYKNQSLAPAGAMVMVVAVILIVLSTLTIVGTRNIGVVTTFGKPSGRTLGNGLHVKAPWQKVTDIDGTITTQKFVGTSAHDDILGCIGVRIGDGSTACVSVVIRSRVNQNAADDIYADYRNSNKDINDQVNDALVRTQLTSALASVFGKFNPLLQSGVEPVTPTKQPTTPNATSAPDLQEFSDAVTQQMDVLLSKVSDNGTPQVAIKSITISYIRLSDQTQNKINQLQAEVANTRVAEQRKLTAAADALANDALAASLEKNPNVLVSKCLDIVAEGKVNIPAFQCWNGTGGGVVLPATK